MHKCSTSHFLLLLDDPEPPSDPLEEPPTTIEFPNTIHFPLSLIALTGNTSP